MSKEISSKFNPEDIESKWYKHWEGSGYFASKPDDREAYSIVIPPPNVTGVLHMGHMLNNTIQDILIRKARKDNKNACWVPGTDHASIATEAKVVAKLREQGIKKSDLTREEFLEKAFEWKEEYGGIILEQLKRLGASCDWDRTAFTMDEKRSEAVIDAFIDLFNKGKLYRALRMVNWDPEAQTVLSNEEVIYGEEQSRLHTVRYQIEGSDEYVVIATTRPETIMGDSAIAVHPDDDRYAHLKGKRAIVPLVDRSIPIIFDDYVDIEFGTGALKVTPAHDLNDYEIGKRHDLEVIDILNDDGTLNEHAKVFIGEDRFVARKSVVKALEASGNLIEVEDYKNNVGRSERTKAIVEPKLSLQWYVDMKAIAKPALDAVNSDEVEFFPKNQKNLYRHWMENIRDWAISRQLWWGHRIPAYYIGEEVFVGKSIDEVLLQAKEKLGREVALSEIKQDEDVLDTWFSSWLWPMSVFDDPEELAYYYPTATVVTGWDIIFLWIARMIMAGYEWKDERPFKDVYFTGMVRDKKRRKMSKSLGNSPDAIGLINTYGADGVRYGMMSFSPAGGDLLFDEKLCETGRNFCNKMWNGMRLLKSWDVDPNMKQSDKNALAIEWIKAEFNRVILDLEKNMTSYRLSESITMLYSLIWNDFSSWFLEMIKPDYQQPIDQKTLSEAIDIMSDMMNALHPFMPFVTEEIWHLLKEQKDDCCISAYPKATEVNKILIDQMNGAKELITKIREIRAKAELKKSDDIEIFYESTTDGFINQQIPGLNEIVSQLSGASKIESIEQIDPNHLAFLSGTTKYFAKIEKEMDVDAEIEKIKQELLRLEGMVKGISKKLSNERFVNNAPEAVVTKEKKKLADNVLRIKILNENLLNLQS